MPGMVNTHTHLFQTLLKGLGDDMVLKKWFMCMTGPSGVHLTPDDAHVAALHGCVESIRSGVTTLVDFMYVHTRPGMIKSVVGAFEQTGMRGFVCRGFISLGEEYGVPRELIEEPEHAIGDAREQMRRYNKPGARVQVGVAPNMIWAVDEKGYRLTRKLADEEHALITTHVAETTFELQTAASRYGQTDTEFSERHRIPWPGRAGGALRPLQGARHPDPSASRHEGGAQPVQQYVSRVGMSADSRKCFWPA